MKSKRQELSESRFKTNCSDCLFAVWDGNVQTGCLHDRVEKFGDSAVEATDSKKDFFVITRVCSLFRDAKWNDGEPSVELSRKEIEPRFSILIDCDKYSEEVANKTMSSIEAIDYDRSKIHIVLSSTSKDNREDLLGMYSKLKPLGFDVIVMASVHKLAREIDGFTKARSSLFAAKITLGDELSNIFHNIEKMVNEDLEMPVIIESGKEVWVLFMLLNMNYLEYNNYEVFLEAAIEIAKKESKYAEIYE